MPHLIFAEAALDDISRLHRFLAPKSSKTAAEAIGAIRRATGAIADTPLAGRPVPTLDPGFREWLVPFGAAGYVLRYRVDPDRVVILRIRHMREAGF